MNVALRTEVIRRAPAGPAPLLLVRSPGRVNLLGEHTDYNGLPVLPMAIDRAVYVAARPTSDGALSACSLDPRFVPCTFPITAALAPSPPGQWSNYLKAAVHALIGSEMLPSGRSGLAITVGADLPDGAGLSSSSALVVATALALLAGHEVAPDRLRLADVLAAGERYVGTLSGGMDQAVILLAQAGAALRIDFFPLHVTPVALPAGHVIVVCDSLERAEKAGAARAAYNRRVVECRLATRILAHVLAVDLTRLGDLRTIFPARALTDFVAVLAERVPDTPLSLAEVAAAAGTSAGVLAPLLATPEITSHAGSVGKRRASEPAGTDVPSHPSDVGALGGFRPLARARHVLSEAMRVEQAMTALAAGDATAFATLMAASHVSCRDDYDVSTPALEALVEAATRAGALGARLTGAGFGGCVVSLVPAGDVERFLDGLDRGFYRSRLPPTVDPARHRYVFSPAAGASVTSIGA